MESTATTLRRILDEPGLVVMPCCHDALSAHLIERAGFPLTFMSGFGVAASRLALPDTGLISYGEVLDQGSNICDAVSIPVIGDADTGYGEVECAVRTTIEYERAGAAALHVEDQVFPKRCGHLDGKELVDAVEFAEKVTEMAGARLSADFMIIAWTDARHVTGMEDAIDRANR